MVGADDPEDILSASLHGLYGLSPITFSTGPGSLFVYPIKPGRVPHSDSRQIELATPDTDPSNWSLHASSIWMSSLFLADHLEELHIGAIADARVLELGAGAGLPSVLLAHIYPTARVTVSDYPDDDLIRVLADNVRRNGLSERCRAVPHAWGTDVAPLGQAWPTTGARGSSARFDVVVAADTLWNSELHAPFLETLGGCLGRTCGARACLVAGLHTGRYTIQTFLDRAAQRGLSLVGATEREVGGAQTRPWEVSRAEGEDERERRRWVVWMVLKWVDSDDLSQEAL